MSEHFDISNNNKPDRYPGIKAFERNQSNLFKGRDAEVKELLGLILGKNCVILFSKSGLGKSSLLNAGLSPALSSNGLFPVNIRLQPIKIKGEKTESPESIVKSNLKHFSGGLIVESSPGTEIESLPLWEYIKSCTFPLGFYPVLLLDQFEEFFYNSEINKEQFLSQLKELLHDEPPVRILDWYKKIPISERTKEQITWCSQPVIKIVIAIREDRFGELKNISSVIPNILSTLYKLEPLSVANAKDAIEIPASLTDQDYSTRKFKYDPIARDLILKQLSGGKTYVETTQLQIVCNQIESIVKGKQENAPGEVTVISNFFEGEKGIDDIIKNFYHKQIDKLPDMLSKGNAKELLETRMVLNQKRILLSEDQVKFYLEQYIKKERKSTAQNIRFLLNDPLKINKDKMAAAKLIEDLLELRLIRGDYREEQRIYEISHDTLLTPINEANRQRRIDAERAERKKRIEYQEKLLKDQKDRAEHELELKLEAIKAKEEAQKSEIKAKDEAKKAKEAEFTAKTEAIKAEDARRVARKYSYFIAACGILLIGAAIAIYLISKIQKETNRGNLSKILYYRAQDELRNDNKSGAFNYLEVAEELKKTPEIDSLFTILLNSVFSGKKMEFNKNSNILTVYNNDSSLFVWNIRTTPFSLIKKFDDVKEYILSSKGDIMAIYKNNQTLYIWNAAEDKLIDSMKILTGSISKGDYYNRFTTLNSKILFSDNGQSLALLDINENIRIYSIQNNRCSLVNCEELYRLDALEKIADCNIRSWGSSDFDSNTTTDKEGNKKKRFRYVYSLVSFSSDGKTVLFSAANWGKKTKKDLTPSSVPKEFTLYSFFLPRCLLQKKITIAAPVFGTNTRMVMLHCDSLFYKAPDKSFHIYDLKSNTDILSKPLQIIFSKYASFTDVDFDNHAQIVSVTEDSLDDWRVSKFIDINTGDLIASITMDNYHYYYSVFNRAGTSQKSIMYVDTTGRLLIRDIPTVSLPEVIDSSSKNPSDILLPYESFVNPALIIYRKGDSVITKNLISGAVKSIFYKNITTTIVVDPNYVIITVKDFSSNKLNYNLIPLNQINKSILKEIYPDTRQKIRNEYKLKH